MIQEVLSVKNQVRKKQEEASSSASVNSRLAHLREVRNVFTNNSSNLSNIIIMENNTSLQQQLLEAGVHFGHLKKKWNPKMLPYIFAEKKGIHIIDLNKTVEGLQEAAAAMKIYRQKR